MRVPGSENMTPAPPAAVLTQLRREEANAVELWLQYKGYHWNVGGPLFLELHRLFDEHAAQLVGEIDALAERLRTLGGPAPYTLEELRRAGRLEEDLALPASPSRMLDRLLASHRVIVEGLREGIRVAEAHDDPGTSDLLVGFLGAHEKMAWFLRELALGAAPLADEGVPVGPLTAGRSPTPHATAFEHPTAMPDRPVA